MGAADGIVSVPITLPSAVAIKVTVTVHELPPGRFALEQVSVWIVKFGEGPTTMFVAVKIVPMRIGDPVVLVTVTVLGGVTEPVFP